MTVALGSRIPGGRRTACETARIPPVARKGIPSLASIGVSGRCINQCGFKAFTRDAAQDLSSASG